MLKIPSKSMNMTRRGKELSRLKKYVLSGLIVLLVLIAGCGTMNEVTKKGLRKQPETAAFRDDFTREFMDSPKEVKDGYYLFKSKTGGYTMLFPIDAKMDQSYYERHKEHFEAIYYGGESKRDNITYYVDTTYENEQSTQNIEAGLKLLSDSIKYDGGYKKIREKKKTIYFAKNIHSLKDGENKVYRFFGYIKSNHTNKGIQYIYAIKCLNKKKKCQVDVKRHEIKAKMLMKSIEF